MVGSILLSQTTMKINNNRIQTQKYCTVIIMIILNKISTFYSNKIKTNLYQNIILILIKIKILI
jgi:hypothetical protein